MKNSGVICCKDYIIKNDTLTAEVGEGLVGDKILFSEPTTGKLKNILLCAASLNVIISNLLSSYYIQLVSLPLAFREVHRRSG